MTIVRNFANHLFEKVEHIITVYTMFPAQKEKHLEAVVD